MKTTRWLCAVCLTALLLAAAPGVMAYDSAAAEPQPVGLYLFEDAGHIGKDSSGNQNDLSVKGVGSVKQTEGPGGFKAAAIDGASVLAAAVDGEGLDFSDSFESMTLNLYIRSDETTFTNQRVVSGGYIGGNGGFTLAAGSDGERLTLFSPVVCETATGAISGSEWNGSDGDTWWQTVYADQLLKEWKSWHLYTIIADKERGRIDLLVDGVIVRTANVKKGLMHLPSKEYIFALGASYSQFGQSENFKGEVAQVSVYDVALAPKDVRALYGIAGDGGAGEEQGSNVIYPNMTEKKDVAEMLTHIPSAADISSQTDYKLHLIIAGGAAALLLIAAAVLTLVMLMKRKKTKA